MLPFAVLGGGASQRKGPQSVVTSNAAAPIADCLNLPVLLFHMTLHFEVELPFALDSLLLHIPDHALMHGLSRVSDMKETRSLTAQHTALSALCW